jgi:hypothetical protein
VAQAKKIATFKLHDAIKERTQVDVVYREKGITKYSYIVLDPGVEYELPEDELFQKSIRGCVFKKPYSKTMEDSLKANNIPYKVELCKQCGGRVKKLAYNPLEVIE